MGFFLKQRLEAKLTHVPNKMNYSWRAHVIQEGTLLALDSDVGPWPKSTNTVHLSTDPQCLLFMGPKLSREELPLPRAAFQQTLVLFWGSKGAWEEGKFSTIFPWRSQKRLTLNMRTRLTQKEKCFLKHSVESRSIALSYPGLSAKCVSWSPVDDLINTGLSPELPFHEEPK